MGGRTIEEAKSRLSHEEVCRWAVYRGKRGSLNLGLRIENGAALIAHMLANWHRKDDVPPFKVKDFAPHLDDAETTIEEIRSWQ